MSIAIVGAGISGLACAWALKQAGRSVVLYEARPRPGGHLLAVPVDIDGVSYPVNAAVGGALHCYLNTFALCGEFGIDLPISPFRLFVEGREGCWAQSTRIRWQDARNPHWRALRDEITRFTNEMHRVYAQNHLFEVGCSVGAYLQAHGYSRRFAEEVLHPLLSLLFEVPTVEETLSTSMAPFPEFYNQVSNDVFSGVDFFSGVNRILPPLLAELEGDIRLETPVLSVQRGPDGVSVQTAAGNHRHSDVVFSCAFDVTRRLLADADAEERNLLSQYTARTEYTTIHTDASTLPPSAPEDEAFAYYCDARRELCTEDLGLFELGIPRRIFRTISGTPTLPIAPESVLYHHSWRREQVTTDSMLMKQWLHRIQGRRRAWYCGLSTTVVGFEFCLLSGLVIADALGGTYPFDGAARASFLKHRRSMLQGGAAPNLYICTPVEA